MNRLIKIPKSSKTIYRAILCWAFSIVWIVLFLFFLAFLNFLEPHEVGVARNAITGKTWLQDEAGWHLTPPWVRVARIDTRPMRVAITTAGHGYNAKLVQFNPDHWREFVKTEGFRYWWWANRISINFGYDEEYRGIKDIFRGYAYGSKQYSFLTLIEEYDTK